MFIWYEHLVVLLCYTKLYRGIQTYRGIQSHTRDVEDSRVHTLYPVCMQFCVEIISWEDVWYHIMSQWSGNVVFVHLYFCHDLSNAGNMLCSLYVCIAPV